MVRPQCKVVFTKSFSLAEQERKGDKTKKNNGKTKEGEQKWKEKGRRGKETNCSNSETPGFTLTYLGSSSVVRASLCAKEVLGSNP